MCNVILPESTDLSLAKFNPLNNSEMKKTGSATFIVFTGEENHQTKSQGRNLQFNQLGRIHLATLFLQQ